MAKAKLPSPELLCKLLRYEPETGRLFWRERTAEYMPRDARRANWNAEHAGKEAFTAIGSHGYHAGSIWPYGTLLAHRVIVAMVTGEWSQAVDHDNRTRTDNRWVNLAPTTHAGNHKNFPMRSDNKSGVTGVYFCSGIGKWRAMIHEGGRPRRLGDFATIDAASRARRKAEIRLGYHPKHGRNPTSPAGPDHAPRPDIAGRKPRKDAPRVRALAS